ncbi:hypothetical protein [Catenuloplanes japonicus]|uniref:hypothetical protein n=1 Tax=Catenuloplanes japonicus TaxID=33876 RepID=UPI0005249AA4|nr:hypothetical protein [Catenuloplanes japonicus]
MSDWLTAMPGQIARLALCLLPGSTPQGERVTTSRTGSPTPARLDVLSLLGPGAATVIRDHRALQPLVRKTAVLSTVTVAGTVRLAGGGTMATAREQQIVTWTQEPVTGPDGRQLYALPDDQVGSIPPVEWLRATVAAWRREAGLSVPGREPTGIAADQDDAEPRMSVGWMLLGPGPGQHADTAAGEWGARFGAVRTVAAADRDVRWLLRWLDEACDRNLGGIPRLHAELRALHSELERALGETRDETYLGRCPTLLTDRDSGAEQPCGFSLWQDPHTTMVDCGRCRSSWAQGRGWLDLAVQIQRHWPVDKRRRYSTEDAERAQASPWAPACSDCGGRLPVGWHDVTEPRDSKRMFRPEIGRCIAVHEQVAA